MSYFSLTLNYLEYAASDWFFSKKELENRKCVCILLRKERFCIYLRLALHAFQARMLRVLTKQKTLSTTRHEWNRWEENPSNIKQLLLLLLDWDITQWCEGNRSICFFFLPTLRRRLGSLEERKREIEKGAREVRVRSLFIYIWDGCQKYWELILACLLFSHPSIYPFVFYPSVCLIDWLT